MGNYSAPAIPGLVTSPNIVINENSLDKDFRVESDDNANMLFVDAGNDRIGIGTGTPSTSLEIQDGLTTTGAVLTLSTKELTVVANDVLGRINFQAPLEATGTDAILAGASIHALAGNTFAASNNETDLVFSTASSDSEHGSATSGAVFERMRITSAGDLGIGTSTPSTSLEIQDGLTTTGAVLTLSTKELTVVANDVLGRISFQAPLEASGTDAILTSASIHAAASKRSSYVFNSGTDTVGTAFAADNNRTDLVFSTASSDVEHGSATSGALFERMRITSKGWVGVGTDTPKGPMHIVTSEADQEVITSDAVNIINGLLIESTYTNNTNSSPMIVFHRNGDDGGSANDKLANIIWIGDNAAGQHILYASCKSYIIDPADNAEEGANSIQLMREGTNATYINCYGGATNGTLGGLLGPEVCINEGSVDIDFRVESNGNAAMLFVDGGNNRVGIGTSVPSNGLDLRHTGADGNNGMMIVRADVATTTGELLGGIGFDATDGNVPSSILEASAFIASFATEVFTDSDKGGNLKFGVSLIDEDDDVVSTIVANVGPPDTIANATTYAGLNSRATTAIVAAATYAPAIGDSGTLVIFEHANSNLTLPSVNNATSVGVQFTVFNETGSDIESQITTSNSATINGASVGAPNDDIDSFKAATFVCSGNNTWIRIG
jgi:hypothetical protein